MTWVLGVDSSFDLFTKDEAVRLRDEYNVKVYAQCLWTGALKPSSAVQSLMNALEAGYIVLGYASIAPHHTGSWHMLNARAGIPEDLWAALAACPVDVELEGLTPGMVYEACDEMEDLGKHGDVYTNYNTWVNILGNPPVPPTSRLWNAFWDGDPDLDFIRLPYGWSVDRIMGEQYSGNTNLGGQVVDLNQFNTELLKPWAPTAIELQGAGTELAYFAKHEWNLGAAPDDAVRAWGWAYQRALWEKANQPH